MIRHVTLLTFDDDTGDDRLAAIADALGELPARIPALRAYTVGPDLGLTDGTATFAGVADFDDEAGFRTYAEDPRHLEIIDAMIKPILVSRVTAQFEVP